VLKSSLFFPIVINMVGLLRTAFDDLTEGGSSVGESGNKLNCEIDLNLPIYVTYILRFSKVREKEHLFLVIWSSRIKWQVWFVPYSFSRGWKTTYRSILAAEANKIQRQVSAGWHFSLFYVICCDVRNLDHPSHYNFYGPKEFGTYFISPT